MPKDFRISNGNSKNRYEKVARSLVDFFKEQEVIAYRESLTEDLQDLESLRKEIENGIIERVVEATQSGNCSEIQEYLKLLEQAQDSFRQFCFIESKVKQRCVRDWNRYLTDVSELKVGSERGEGAFLVQTIGCDTNIARIVKGPAVSTNLVTSELQYLFRQRKIGVLYRLTEYNLLTLGVSDLYSDVKILESEEAAVDSLFHWNLINDTYSLVVSEDEESKFYPFNEFVRVWKDRIVRAELEERYNEVLLMPNFENDLIGAFYLASASDGEKDRAAKIAELTTGVLIELQPDGRIKRIK